MLLINEQREGEMVALSLKNKNGEPTQGTDVGTKSSSIIISILFCWQTSKIWHCYFGFVEARFVFLYYMEPGPVAFRGLFLAVNYVLTAASKSVPTSRAFLKTNTIKRQLQSKRGQPHAATWPSPREKDMSPAQHNATELSQIPKFLHPHKKSLFKFSLPLYEACLTLHWLHHWLLPRKPVFAQKHWHRGQSPLTARWRALKTGQPICITLCDLEKRHPLLGTKWKTSPRSAGAPWVQTGCGGCVATEFRINLRFPDCQQSMWTPPLAD